MVGYIKKPKYTPEKQDEFLDWLLEFVSKNGSRGELNATRATELMGVTVASWVNCRANKTRINTMNMLLLCYQCDIAESWPKVCDHGHNFTGNPDFLAHKFIHR